MSDFVVVYVEPTITTVVASWSKPLPASSLFFQAPGLDVYVVKARGVRLNKYTHETIGNLAVQECINRNIPVMSLRRVR